MILYIDTSDNEKLTIALVDKAVFVKKMFNVIQNLSEVLLGHVDKTLKSKRVKLQNLSKVAVVVGPGHFSRVRTGVILANTLGFSLNVPVLGLKKEEGLDLKKILSKYGEKMVKPYYNQAPNITKPKKKIIKN